MKSIDLNYLKKPDELRKICLDRIILWWTSVVWRTLTLLVPLCFHLVGCRWKKYQIIYIYSYKGLSTYRWGTPGRWGTPPGRDRLHLYLRRSLRDQKHHEAEIRQCCKTSWAEFTFCSACGSSRSKAVFNKVLWGFLYIFSFLLWSANDRNFVRLLVCL